jgi:glycosyltransferase involved in cell wall biosynthesis
MTAAPRVAIVHYHLRSGGVTRVIRHAVRALCRGGATVAILTGEPPGDGVALPPGVVVRVIDGLGYEDRSPSPAPPRLAGRMRDAVETALAGPPDLWHVHNHALGKNTALPGALGILADEGRRILLQPHDFAEDGRPANYRRLRDRFGADPTAPDAALYPVAEHVHYATLNHRDRRRLVAAGLDGGRVHLLQNPVDLAADDTDGEVEAAGADAPGTRLFLYATRAIRRKNLGELLLWAALGEEGDRFATTLAPTSAVDLPGYARWRAFAAELGLPLTFEIGAASDASYRTLLRSARALVTTSVAEGFGLAFLEPWLVGRPLVGRNLAPITGDFVASGIDLGPLYERLEVPLPWVGRDALRERLARALERVFAAYGEPSGEPEIEAAMGGAVREDRVDFGRLDEALQEQVIERLFRSPAARSELAPRSLLTADFDDSDRIRRNRESIRDAFSIECYARTLGAIHERVLASPVTPVDGLPPRAVLRQFLDPAEFFLLRT